MRRTRDELDATWGVLAVLIPTAVTAGTRTQALDLAYHLRAGAEMLASGEVLRTDTFTFTVYGEPWLNQQWASQIFLAMLQPGDGWLGPGALRALAVGVTMLLVFRACRALGTDVMVASGLTLGGWFVGSVIVAQLRPQTFAIVLFALTGWLVATRTRGVRRLWLLPIVTLAWVNLHGSFPLVFAWLGIAAIDDLAGGRRTEAVRSLLVALVCLGVTVVNPFGVRVWSYLLDLATNTVVSERIGEWGSPSPGTLTGGLFWMSLLVVALVSVRRRLPVGSLVGLAGFGLLSVLAVRGVVWWAVALPILLAPAFASGERPKAASGRERSRLAIVVALALTGLTIVGVVRGARIDRLTGAPAMLSFAPERLVDALRSSVSPGSRVFASQFHASWAEYSAAELWYGVDSRVELFPDEVWNEYFEVSNGEDGWDAALDEAGVDAVLLDPDQATALLAEIRGHRDWRLVLESADGAVFIRA